MLKIKNKLPIIILFMCIISIFLVMFPYISLGLSTLCLLLCLFFSKANIRIMTIVISIATIITNGMILYKQTSKIDTDIFEGKNILVGTWNYNLDNSTYVFNENYTYFQYDDIKNKDNYCTGTYKYIYGGTSNDGKIITNDDNYYYYDLIFNIDYCTLDNKIINNNYEETLVFGISKIDYYDLVFMDVKNNYAFKVTKVLE